MIRIQITSAQNPRLLAAMHLQSSRARKTQQRIIVFGLRECLRAMKAGLQFVELFVCPDLLDDALLGALEAECDLRCQAADRLELSPDLFRKIAYGDRTDGVAGVAMRPATQLSDLSVSDNSLMLIVESIEKPGNLGAVVRSADGAGASAVIAADPATDFFHPNSIRASVSTVFSLPVAAAPSVQVAEWLVANGFRIVIASLAADRTFFDVDLSGKVAIVLGNEANGVTDLWQRQERSLAAALPMAGSADSLNISAAASAILYLAARQRAGGV